MKITYQKIVPLKEVPVGAVVKVLDDYDDGYVYYLRIQTVEESVDESKVPLVNLALWCLVQKDANVVGTLVDSELIMNG